MVKRASLLAILLFVSSLAAVRADVVEAQPGFFIAGVRTEKFQFIASQGRQHQSNWCWAACVQMVLQYHGLDVTQEQVVQKVYGRLVDATADGQQVIYALNGWVPDSNGGTARVRATSYGVNQRTVLDDLAAARPLIVGMRGYPGNHAFVLTAFGYRKDGYGNVYPVGVVLRDPWPNNPSRQEMSWQEFSSRVYFVARVQVQH